MKILIIGARGMLGQDVVRELQGTGELFQRDLPELDITDRAAVLSEIRALQPDTVINCAAYTDVDGCETQQATAFAVNADGPRHIALACRETGSRMFHISTDFVFDGTKSTPYVESDMPNPLSVYAASKLEGERQVHRVLPQHVIIRTSWLFGRRGKNFVTTIKKLAEENKELRVVNDQRGCPTHTVDLAQAVRALMSVPAHGRYHVCNAGCCTWYEFAMTIIALCGCDTTVLPITSSELARPAKRPAFSVMDCRKFSEQTGLTLRSWQEALKAYILSLTVEES